MQRPRGGYIRAASGQWLVKHVPVGRHQVLNNATVGLQHWKSCFIRSLCREVISETRFGA
jgi:hypothetical protein